jgi:hypothetical protein
LQREQLGPHDGIHVGFRPYLEDCALRLSDAGGQVGRRHARVWLREGRFMLHHLDRRLTTSIGERTVDWAVLEPGDET